MRTLLATFALLLVSNSTLLAGDWTLESHEFTTTNATLEFRLRVCVTKNYQTNDYSYDNYLYVGFIADNPYPGVNTYRWALGKKIVPHEEGITAVFGIVEQKPLGSGDWTSTSTQYNFSR